MSEFWTLRPEWKPGEFATLGELERVADDVPNDLRHGRLVGPDLGAKARFVRSSKPYQFGPSGKKTPAGKAPVDLFKSKQAGCLVASARLAEALLEADAVLTLSRVSIVDVEGVDHGFVITAPLVDALDLKKSGAKLERVRGLPDELVSAKKLILDAARVPSSRAVFRLPLLSTTWFVRDAVKERLADFIGLEFEDPAKTSFGD
jgi:hypothetical protein